MPPIRRLVLDVLKPHEPGIVQLTERIADLEGVDGATATLVEIEEDVRSIWLVVEGPDLDPEAIETAIVDLGGSVHSIDGVSSGTELVEEARFTVT